MTLKNLKKISIQLHQPLNEVIQAIQDAGAAACALVYDNEVYLNIITDGDVRRALLVFSSMEITAAEILQTKALNFRKKTITIGAQSTVQERKQVFAKFNLRQLIVIDASGRPVDVITHQQIGISPVEVGKSFNALIMAGGLGTRLRPLTDNLPKPMLPINGVPLLELIVLKLKSAGASKVFVSTHYLPEKISNHFGDGSRFGIQIEYLNEGIPLGTGGCLSLIKDKTKDVLVINGDILTELDLSMFYGNHLRSHADLSIATSIFSIKVPFGVVDADGGRVIKLTEKPSTQYLINSGIYVISRGILNILPAFNKYNITDLISNLLDMKKEVVHFPMFEKWLDIGQIQDYEDAQRTIPQ